MKICEKCQLMMSTLEAATNHQFRNHPPTFKSRYLFLKVLPCRPAQMSMEVSFLAPFSIYKWLGPGGWQHSLYKSSIAFSCGIIVRLSEGNSKVFCVLEMPGKLRFKPISPGWFWTFARQDGLKLRVFQSPMKT